MKRLIAMLESALASEKGRKRLKAVGFLIGFFVGLMTVFQVLFLYRVLPHGGF
ncbi:MAG: hypothetical protein NDJ89_10190 [Oligoflexia bacterium]|nr:hypothetical protein [Oligoflexia bacterium]